VDDLRYTRTEWAEAHSSYGSVTVYGPDEVFSLRVIPAKGLDRDRRGVVPATLGDEDYEARPARRPPNPAWRQYPPNQPQVARAKEAVLFSTVPPIARNKGNRPVRRQRMAL
jgi:hypothetical protein